MVSDYTGRYTFVVMAYRPGPYPCLLASITASIAGGAVLLVAARRLLRVEVQGQSMAPGLLPGDRLLAVRGLAPRPGDVVTATDPRLPSRVLVKRVVGVDADQVELAGDNAEGSTDSRSFGPVPAALVTARVLWRYWPSHRRGGFPLRSASGGDRPAVLG